MCVISVQPKTRFLKKYIIDRYSVTGIGYWWSSNKQYNGWPIGNIDPRPTKTWLGKIHCQGFKDVCQFCQVRLQPRDDSDKLRIDLPQPHCQQGNVCFNCLIYYDNEWSLTDNQCMWYEAHFRNGLRNSVLDEDLSQAQLVQLEEFLDLDVDSVLS